MSAHRKTSAAGTRNIFARSGTLYRVIFTMGLPITRARFCLHPIRRCSARASAASTFALCAPITRARLESVIRTRKRPCSRRRCQSHLVTAAEHWAVTATVQFTLASTVRSFSCRTAQPQIDRLGTSNVAPLLVGGQINPALSQNHIQVIKEHTRQNLSAFTSGPRCACPLSEVTPVTHLDLNRLRFTANAALHANDVRKIPL